MTELHDLETKLGRRFTHPALLEQALTHGSVRHEHQTSDATETLPAIEDNERLEFLGDAIVGMVVAELLYRRYPDLDEGELTRLRAALVSRKHLGQVGTALDLGSYLRLGHAEERNGGRQKAVLLANCMEALIGALYLEDGLPSAAAFVERTVVLPYMDQLRGDLRENPAIGDYKTALQELLQARRAGQPEYTVKSESGPDHRKRFLVQVRASHGGSGSRAEGVSKAEGEGSTKKRAEQEAARRLYEQLKAHRHESQPTPEPHSEPSPTASSPAAPYEGQQHPTPAFSSPATSKSAVNASTKKSKRTRAATSGAPIPPIPLTKQARHSARAHAAAPQQTLALRSQSSRPGSRNNPS